MAWVRKTNRTRPAPRTAFKKGHKKVGGRKKGTPNKFTGELKQYVLDALANAHKDGAQGYLLLQSRKNAKAFMQLVSKLLPTQLTGKDGAPIELLVNEAIGKLGGLSDAELEQLSKLLAKAGFTGIPQGGKAS